MSERILCIDDDPNILAAYQRQLRKRFEIDVALSGEDGLRMLKERGPYAVIVTDLAMPRMNGIEFLTRARDLCPGSVRMMLTGNATEQTAIEAVNSVNVFRFLTKPCLPEAFARALEAGVEQHRLVMAEKELLEKTLSGSIHVLTETLSLVNPAAFGRASRLKRFVRHIARQLKLEALWPYELAAMLSQIGCVTLPSGTVEKVYAGEPIDRAEQDAYSLHPTVGARLLASIPRLEAVAGMIEGQNRGFVPEPGFSYQSDPVKTGAALLHVAIDFDDRLGRGLTADQALAELRHRGDYDPTMLAALENIHILENQLELRLVRVSELRLHMILDADVRARTGILLVARGQDVTYSVIECLRNFASRVGVQEPLRVLVPRVTVAEDPAGAAEGDAASENSAGAGAPDGTTDASAA